jgi:hypothetical protein
LIRSSEEEELSFSKIRFKAFNLCGHQIARHV